METTQILTGGVFALLLIREARELVKIALEHRRNGDGGAHHGLTSTADPTEQRAVANARGKIHEMHRVVMREAGDGVPLIYRHPDVAESLDTIAANTQQANDHLQAIRDRGSG